MEYFAKPQASSAVKIVKPEGGDVQLPPFTKPPKKDLSQRHCKNVHIYGQCKFEGQGCPYYHPPTESDAPRAESPISSSLSAQAINAPVFVPKSSPAVTVSPTLSNAEAAQPQPTQYAPPASPYAHSQHDYPAHEPYDSDAYNQGLESLESRMADLDLEGDYSGYGTEYDGAMDASFYSTAPVFVRQPLNYHLYTPVASTRPPKGPPNHFIPPSPELRERLTQQSEVVRGIAPAGLNVPEEMSGYHTLVPLDSPSTPNERRRFGNWFSSVYRAINSVDGLPYALRRVENFRLINQTAFQPIDVWSNIHHPGIVHVHEAFTTRAFNDNSLVVAYTYHPNAQTLYDMHFKNRNQQQQQYGSTSRFQPAQVQTLIPERTIWSYIVQIASAVKKVHDLGQAVRMIDISKILVTSQNRVRIGSCGIIDILMHETPQDMTILQQEDLHMFGRLVFALCTLNPSGASSGNFSKSLELMGRNYSADMKNVALYLISKSGPHRTIGQLFDIINSKVVAEMDDALIATDTLEHELRGELENARLVRLMTMFGFITERPEFARDPRWSETGDRYIIKLFRDYVFHQVDEHGNPVISMSHVLTCMNKLDAGADERVMLVARDEQSCLVVTYKEIKQCMESAFGELMYANSSTGTFRK